MNKKLYVGNLDYTTTKDQLTQLFSQAGKVVDVMIITNRTTGKSKGYGFVEMDNENDAKKAIEMFNEKDIQGRNIVVNEASPIPPQDIG